MIPIYQPSLLGKEKEYVNDCLDSSWISSKGKYINQFETAFAGFVGVKYAASVCNGTVAIHLALIALGIGPGDEVIVPTLTYIASVNAISYTGAKPVFVDSLPDTWQMDPEDVRKKISDKTKAIMVVHLYGHPCNMNILCKIADDHGLFVVEDCAEAIGSRYKDKHVGTFGNISAFSFFGNKTITTGEGGMVVSNDEALYQKSVHFKGQGLVKNRQYWHDVIGYNYRMTNIEAAIGLAQLEQVDGFLTRKQEIADRYASSFERTCIQFHKNDKDVYHSYWMCSILVSEATDRDKLRIHMETAGIETRPLFFPVHTMPMYTSNSQSYPIAEDLGMRGINLPSYPDLTNSDVDRVVRVVKDYFGIK